jgi:DNA-binding transcriptional MocR family regulator
LAEAGRYGIVFGPGEFFCIEKGGENALRLKFSSQLEEQIREGIARLGQASDGLRARAVAVPESEQLVELFEAGLQLNE